MATRLVIEYNEATFRRTAECTSGSSSVKRFGTLLVGGAEAIYHLPYFSSIMSGGLLPHERIATHLTHLDEMCAVTINGRNRIHVIDGIVMWSDPDNRPILLMQSDVGLLKATAGDFLQIPQSAETCRKGTRYVPQRISKVGKQLEKDP